MEDFDIAQLTKQLRNYEKKLKKAYTGLLDSANNLVDVVEEETGGQVSRNNSAELMMVSRNAKDDQRMLKYTWDYIKPLVTGYIPFFDLFSSTIPNLNKDKERIDKINDLIKKYPKCQKLRDARFLLGWAQFANVAGALYGMVIGAIQAGLLVTGAVALVTGAGAPATAVLWGVYAAISTANPLKNPFKYLESGMINAVQDVIQDVADDSYEGSMAYSVSEDEGSTGGGGIDCPQPEFVNPPRRTDPIIDPSGYVYEAVESNRIEGATVTAIQRVTRYDMYDEPYTEDIEWDAEPYQQVNPQITNERGEFAWDVPDGLWSVKVTMDDYDTVQTDWMEVPPERKDVNIALVSKQKPLVTDAVQGDDGITVTFMKHVFVKGLESAFTMTADGHPVKVKVKCLDEESSPKGDKLARNVLVSPTESIRGMRDVVLKISGSITSYAGVKIGKDVEYQAEPVDCRIEVPESLALMKGDSATLKVVTKPAGYLKGMKLEIEATKGILKTKQSVTLDDKGKASVKINTLKGGEGVVTLRLSGTKLTASVRVTSIDLKNYNVLKLPAKLKKIEDDAFRGISAEIVVIPKNCKAIGSKAFRNCSNLKYILVPAGKAIDIAEDAYDKGTVTVVRY